VSCRFSREMLALHVGGDLPEAATATTVGHLASCDECRRFLEELRASQALIRSVRRETVSPSECTAMRREVMTIINERQGVLLGTANRARPRSRAQAVVRNGRASAAGHLVGVYARSDAARH
jgi:anti-sigma factor RsiW